MCVLSEGQRFKTLFQLTCLRKLYKMFQDELKAIHDLFLKINVRNKVRNAGLVCTPHVAGGMRNLENFLGSKCMAQYP